MNGLHPIIRRVRRPLLPPEPIKHPAAEVRTAVPSAEAGLNLSKGRDGAASKHNPEHEQVETSK
jgi:hypothetical protein